MSDKKMLNETTIRKMMKLANIPSLTDKFIKENYFDYPQVTEQEEELDVEVEDDAPMDEPAIDDAPMEEPEMDLDVDMEEPAGDDLPAAEELVQDLMGVLEKHFDDVEFNVDVEGDDEPMDEPAMDPEPEMDLDVDADDAGGEMDLDVDVDEEEPVLEEVPGDLADLGAMAAGEAEEEKADEAFMEEETLEEEELEEMEDEHAHSKLIDAIAAKVAERLLAEAKKTNE